MAQNQYPNARRDPIQKDTKTHRQQHFSAFSSGSAHQCTTPGFADEWIQIHRNIAAKTRTRPVIRLFLQVRKSVLNGLATFRARWATLKSNFPIKINAKQKDHLSL
jgi:hypothetical protein